MALNSAHCKKWSEKMAKKIDKVTDNTQKNVVQPFLKDQILPNRKHTSFNLPNSLTSI